MMPDLLPVGGLTSRLDLLPVGSPGLQGCFIWCCSGEPLINRENSFAVAAEQSLL